MTTTIRSQFRLYWSTAPALVGYPETREQMLAARAALLSNPPAFRGTPRAILNKMARIRRDVGGAFVAFFVQAADGREVDVGELKEIVQDADFRAMRTTR